MSYRSLVSTSGLFVSVIWATWSGIFGSVVAGELAGGRSINDVWIVVLAALSTFVISMFGLAQAVTAERRQVRPAAVLFGMVLQLLPTGLAAWLIQGLLMPGSAHFGLLIGLLLPAAILVLAGFLFMITEAVIDQVEHKPHPSSGLAAWPVGMAR